MRMGGAIIDSAIKLIDGAYQTWKKTEHDVKKLLGRNEELKIEKEMTELYDLGSLIQPLISKRSIILNIYAKIYAYVGVKSEHS